VTDSEGLNSIISKSVTVKGHPQADFNWLPQFPQAYEITTFDASSSEPNGGAIVSYTWDFGDGNLTQVANPTITHRYEVSGDYVVTLNVTDNEGLWDTETKTLTAAAAEEPNADFTWSPPSPHLGETITFDASTSTPNGGIIISYRWDFGDSNITTLTDPIIHHVYFSGGNYTVALRVMDSQGLWSAISKTVNLLPPTGPTAAFIWYPSIPKPNQTVTFDASSSTLGWNGTHHPPIVSYSWDFGDGNITTVTDPAVDHIYVVEGNYAVTLTVIDINGLQDNLTQTVIILSTTLIGDITGPAGVPDGVVDMRDVAFVAIRFGAELGDPNYDPRADLTGPTYLVPDGVIDMRDIALVATHFGDHPFLTKRL
jgi:PKD repeat protein